MADEVSPVSGAQGVTLKLEPKGDLTLPRNRSAIKREAHGFVIDGLEKASTKGPMHTHGSADDGVGLLILLIGKHELR